MSASNEHMHTTLVPQQGLRTCIPSLSSQCLDHSWPQGQSPQQQPQVLKLWTEMETHSHACTPVHQERAFTGRPTARCWAGGLCSVGSTVKRCQPSPPTQGTHAAARSRTWRH